MLNLVHPAQLDPRLADLTRPRSTGASGGVCRALAQRWQVDPIIVRLVLLALTFAGGIGIALYAWCWLLTPREGGSPPILRWLPAFETWPKRTQTIVVAVSSLILVLSVARTTGLSWGPVIVVGALAWAMARRQRNRGSNPTPSAPFTPGQQLSNPTGAADVHTSARGGQESVEQWRTRLSPHAGTGLPMLDLYAPEFATAGSTPIQKQRRSSWLAAAVILLLMTVAATVPVVIGLDPAVLWAGVAASGTAGVLILLFSLVVRSRRLPMLLLALVLMGAVGTGLLAVQKSAVSTARAGQIVAGDQEHRFFGQAPGDLDLTGLEFDQATTILIDATASVVRIQLDEPPGAIEVLSDTIHVEPSYSNRSQSTSNLTLVIDGDMSVVDIETLP